ncbi:M13 family metallopeptidase [Riemerella anatipestifer]|uniref:M13 family metallopeptidase n=1 Tax=Riemerella anatipestifer TaxID=34085 RepID=UPI00208E36FC|nr:M13 family metallopeptidase [Riemerella anatipestifer]MCO4303585.1 M13 family metallopeptidase [Riemerella anatipestifer]MCO7352657.1 M13 family metallopeptidase [Riemerella anatipestifer]MCQ4038802.1 M13 family metallopeptidase [Riemerella anatipestifer]MCT6760511.1 M13 family metallopeptidase [Riemerella anatipestifer]MCT6764872.1 M13 family metallopeptidase [Riemerella anatipestifer]
MKKITLSLLALSGALAFQSCSVNKKVAHTEHTSHAGHHHHEEHGISLEYMDTNVRPQDDFYNFVNGGWMRTAVIPSDKASWGSFNELREKTDEASLTILKNILSETYAEGTEGKKIQTLYASFMNMDKRNAEGINPIKNDLAKIEAIKNLADLQTYLTAAVRTGDNPLYSWYAYTDLKNSKMNTIYLGGPRLGLGRDYYQKENAENTKTLNEYQKYVASLLDVLGYKNSNDTAKKIVDLEKTMAKTLLTNEEGRDANKRYNPKNTSELPSLVKNVNLSTYLKEAGVNTDRVILGELGYYQNLDKFINSANLPLIKDYLKLRLISGNADNLDKRLDDISFNFYSKYLQGQKEQRAMEKRGLSLINGVLGEAFGKLYVDKYFPAEAKTEMETLISYLKKSYQHHIENLDWMSAETKVKALDKLNKFTVKVAYPDKWEDYSKLNFNNGSSLYDNLKQVSLWAYEKTLAEKVNKPVDKSKWGMTPQTVNAYYNPTNNEIVFPAAILQPPFFNFKADPAVNFGGIGAVIGHEISHGFDDGGSRFDGDGNLSNWWTDADRKNFDIKVKQLADQYSKYEPVKGSFVNGVFTSGENIADLGGVAIAYDALKMYLKDKGNPGEISGYNQDQRFFMSWATVWRTKSTEQYMINQVKTDPHSPGYFRSFGPLVNVDAWYDAFKVEAKDKHYKKPEDRIKIW